MDGARQGLDPETFLLAFPTIRHTYSVVAERPQNRSSEPVDIVCPARGERRHLSLIFLYTAKAAWRNIRDTFDHMRRIRWTPQRDLPLEELVLI